MKESVTIITTVALVLKIVYHEDDMYNKCLRSF
jgi:hypothetical protein